MKTIRYRSTGEEVFILEDMLSKLGYDVIVNEYFGVDTDTAIKDFQLKNSLIVDGIVGIKSWSKLFALQQQLFDHNDKFLSEQDLIDLATELDIELAAIKAVNESGEFR